MCFLMHILLLLYSRVVIFVFCVCLFVCLTGPGRFSRQGGPQGSGGPPGATGSDRGPIRRCAGREGGEGEYVLTLGSSEIS